MAKDRRPMVKKRKRSSAASLSADTPSSESKRKRDVDASVLNLLTGKSENESSPKKESKHINTASEKVVNTEKDVADEVKKQHLAWPQPLSQAHADKMNVTVLLENANLEVIQQHGRSGGVVLLNCDDHRNVLNRTKRNVNDARPDITHQCLLTLLDSPLNKAGRLKVYIRTAKNVLISVHPQIRIPRTYKRFAGLMAECLEKFKVRGTTGSVPLLQVIRNPIVSHLPVGTRKIVCTYNTENVIDMRKHAADMAQLVLPNGTEAQLKDEEEVKERGEEVNVLYVVGAMAHGKVTEDWADDYICVSDFPLSASTVCSRLTYAYECLFGLM